MTFPMTDVLDVLRAAGACRPALAWLPRYPDLRTAWDETIALLRRRDPLWVEEILYTDRVQGPTVVGVTTGHLAIWCMWLLVRANERPERYGTPEAAAVRRAYVQGLPIPMIDFTPLTYEAVEPILAPWFTNELHVLRQQALRDLVRAPL